MSCQNDIHKVGLFLKFIRLKPGDTLTFQQALSPTCTLPLYSTGLRHIQFSKCTFPAT